MRRFRLVARTVRAHLAAVLLLSGVLGWVHSPLGRHYFSTRHGMCSQRLHPVCQSCGRTKAITKLE